MNVLLPLDDSDCSSHTLAWVLNFLNPSRDTLYLLHIAYHDEGPELALSEHEVSQPTMSQAADRLRQAGFWIGAVQIIRSRQIGQTICRYAAHRPRGCPPIDQVIIGTHGQGFFKRLQESVSQDVLRCVTKPMLLIRCCLEAGSLYAFDLGDRKTAQSADYNKLLIPISESDASSYCLEWIIRNLDPRRTLIHLLHVVPMIGAAGVIPQYLTEGELLIHQANIKMREAGYTVVNAQVAVGTPIDEICHYTDTHAVDAIWVGVAHREHLLLNILGNIGHQLLTQANRPVIAVFPEPGVDPDDVEAEKQHLARGVSPGRGTI